MKLVPHAEHKRAELEAALRGGSPPHGWHPWNRFAASLPAALIAEGLNLGGLAYTLDAACASSLYALKFACEELRAHRADAMLAGGMSRPDCQYTQMGFGQLTALSRHGSCAPLSAAADGLVVGEGAGIFVLKRLADAIGAGDKIYGVIAGIGLSNDRGANLLAPHSEGQLRAMRAAYDEAGWRPSDVDLIECHATGTPVGDGVEIASLHQLWQHEAARPGQCVIGGVKSNVGHLLTGAGAAGLMKVLFALKHQMLPPTANYERPAAGIDPATSPFRVLATAEPWPLRHGGMTPRRATVNAFGFGGINAHVLIEEFESDQSSVRSTGIGSLRTSTAATASTTAASDARNTEPNIAIVGLAGQVGNDETLDDHDASFVTASDSELGASRNRWGVEQSDWYRSEFRSREDHRIGNACAITSVALPLGKFRIPPLEMPDMLPQQQLMLKIVAAALEDATVRRTEHAASGAAGRKNEESPSNEALGNRTGVFIGIELDPNTTNFHLRWSMEELAPQWADLLGLTLTTDERSAWMQQLKDAISPALNSNRVMGNLGGIVASRLAREFNVGGPSFTISSDQNSGLRACELAAHSLRRGELDRAIVGAVDFPCDIRSLINERRAPGSNPSASIKDGATAVVLKRLEDAVRDGDRIHAVIRRINHSLSLATDGSSRTERAANLESIGAATGLVELTRAVNSLSDGNHVGSTITPWLRNRCEGVRQLEVPGRGVDGRNLILELIEYDPAAKANLSSAIDVAQTSLTHAGRGNAGHLPAQLLVVDGDSLDELSAALDQLSLAVESSGSLERLAQRWFRQRTPRPRCRLAVVLVPRNLAELPQVLQAAKGRLIGNSPQEPDRRVYFSAQPLGSIGHTAFVFPGSGNAFLGMGRELLSAFPEVLAKQDAENERLRDQYRPDLIWFANSTAQLLEDHKAMIFGQVALGTAICDLLARFHVSPAASIGYSLGESAALFGLRAWIDRDEMLQRMHDASLFGSDLVKPFNAARRSWNVSQDSAVDWVSGVVDRSAADLRHVLDQTLATAVTPSDRTRAYLLIINTPTQCVIGGERVAVDRLVRQLGATFTPFSAPSTVHCSVLRQVEPAYRALHLMRTFAPKGIDFYSAAWGRSYPLTRESAAEAIVAQAVDTIDFPRVIEQAYADGVRTFVEIGPGTSCTRMIDEILANRPHFARSATPATATPVNAFLELLASLIAERVPVNLGYLYGGTDVLDESTPSGTTERQIATRVGGKPFEIPIPAGGWCVSPVINGHLSKGADAPRCVSETCIAAPTATTEITSSRSRMTSTATTEIVGINGMAEWDDLLSARIKAHETYLRVSTETQRLVAEQLELLHAKQDVVVEALGANEPTSVNDLDRLMGITTNDRPTNVIEDVKTASISQVAPPAFMPSPVIDTPPRSLSREQCMEFAIGRIGQVLGRKFAEIDQHPTRVRLPDEPLMLVDRILEIDGEPLSMTSGRVVTEHDIHAGAWYLDCDRIPTCIAVEAGQADLFLSGWLGIDLQTKGVACYRLLDAVVTFHRELPRPGQMIHYDIRINHFFRQGQTYLFRFEFDATVDGQPLLTMREGCAGFFTEAELAGGKGIVHTALDKQPRPGKRPGDWSDPVPMVTEQYDDAQVLGLRQGQLDRCFGAAFARLSVNNPETIPGLVSRDDDSRRTRMWLVDRIMKLDPAGGKFGLGTILGELDIHPDDWFLTCHFCDDQVMPGTLMYECCLHTLRIYLLRMGWIGESGTVVYEPVPGIRSRLKCRGQVRANTKKVWYEITLKELGYGGPSEPSSAGETPYCLADALMYADGKPIVEITDMSVRLSGLTRAAIERLWSRQGASPTTSVIQYDRRPPLFDVDRITAFAVGNPSDAFGDRYRVFDAERVIARLPGPPFQFLDRIVEISGCQPWVLQAGGQVTAQYDIPPDAWYFSANRQQRMPFAVLLETALQPCGWLAAYVGSALTSTIDLSFRNLGGTATQFADVTSTSGTLTTTVKMTRVSNSGGMIIQHYDFDLRCNDQPVYVGNTYFGFFSKASLVNQIGIRDAKPFVPSADETARSKQFAYLDRLPFADARFQMIDHVQLSKDNGPHGLGFAIGTMSVDPSAWFFKAHFHQDPVVPGSLGLESFFQLLKIYAAERWQLGEQAQFAMPIVDGQSRSVSSKHEWVYRGQVIPRDQTVTVTAVIKRVDDAAGELVAEGFLSVDGRVIYQMKDFSLKVMNR